MVPMAWQRGDMAAKTTKTSMRGGPEWQQVKGRVTADANTGEVIKVEEAQYIIRNTEHALIPNYPRDIVTVLFYEPSNSRVESNGKKVMTFQSGPRE